MTARYFDVEAVELAGTQLVEASAGTGKTYAISTLVVRLLLETDWTIDSILVVTFTEAATSELKDRVRRRIREAHQLIARPDAADSDLRRLVARHPPERARAKLERALADFDHAGISTIHGFCQRALLENAFASRVPFEAELVRDPRPLIEEIVLDFWAREVGPASRIFVEHLRDANITPQTLEELSRWVARTARFRPLPEGLLDAERDQERFGVVDTTFLEKALERARETFDEASVLRALETADLNGNRYRRAHLPRWVHEVAVMLDSDRELPLASDHFDKFRTETLIAASRSHQPPEHPFFAAADELATEMAAVSAELGREKQAFYAALVRTVRRDFKRRKLERGLLTFDDLLFDLEEALGGRFGGELRSGLRKRFPVALIDEFQDTDPLQYSIFRRIYGDGSNPMFLIGDPKQAIYSFRGADVFAYLGAASTVPGERRFTMRHNYRSDARLVEAVNALFSQAADPFFLSELAFTKVEVRDPPPTAPSFPAELELEPLQFRFVPRPKDGETQRLDQSQSERAIPELVAREVSRLLASGMRLGDRAVSPRDIAILTRTNAQAFECQRALQRLRIPSVVLGDRSVFQYQEAAELGWFLAAALEPQNQRAVRAALCTELLGVKVGELLEMETDPVKWDRWADRFKTYHQRWVTDGFIQMMRLALEECQIPERLLGLVDGERRMTNLLHLVELLHVEAMARHLGPSGLLHHLAESRARLEAPEDSEQIRLESDEDTITLTTVHKSKGLEYGIVFCPFPFRDILVLNAERAPIHFHDAERGRELTLALGIAERERHLPDALDEALAENLRLLYVALTRAKHATVVYWCSARGYEESALGYLLHGKDARSIFGSQVREQVRTHLKGLDDAALLGRLEELAQEVDGIGVSVVDPGGQAPPYQSQAGPSLTLEERRVSGPLPIHQRTSSFTELSRGLPELTIGPAEGRDHDERRALELLGQGVGERCLLADFPGGARTGNFFHAVLERWDFTQSLPKALVLEQLLAHALDPALADLAQRAFSDIVKAPLSDGADSFRLCDLEATARCNELEFHLPVMAGPTFASSARPRALLTPQALAAVFGAHPSASVSSRYAEDVAALSFLPLRGFVKGFIDLAFEHQGKWYLVDYKSNRLGDLYENHGPADMMQCMAESHYYLQYHLYTVALHRLLLHKKRGYDYDVHFGGVFYLFLRGLGPGRDTGVFFEKPPHARVEAFSRLLEVAS